MTFLAPIVLSGLAAVGLPVLIHLLNKSQVKVMKWAAMKFLVECVRKNERKMKLEDLLLLLLRCLLVVLLVLAFALPALKGTGSLAGNSGPLTAMLVLDRSASMAYNNGQETRLDEAKTAAVKLLDSSATGSTAGLILAGSFPDAVVPSPSADLPLVKRRIQLVETDAGKSDLYPALKLAVEALHEGNLPQPQIHIFTDDAAFTWSREGEIAKLRQENPGIEFLHHPVGAGETDNTSITALKTEVASPVAGEPLPLVATIKNWGKETARDIRVTASVDRGATQAEELVSSLGAGEERNVLLNVKTEEAGFHTVEVKTPADRIPGDNSRALAFRAQERGKVLIVRDERTKASGPSSAFFIAQALLPVPREQLGRAALTLTEKTPQEATSLKLQDFSLVILSDPRDLSALWDTQTLLEYVQGGGNLLVVPGENASARPVPFPESWNPLLPALAGRLETPPQDKPAFGLQISGFNHPVMAPWNDTTMGSLGSILMTRRFPLQPTKAPEDGNAPQTVLAFADGKPALVDWKVGGGHVGLAAFPLELGWTNFYLHPSFLAIIQRWVDSVSAGGGEVLNIAPHSGFGHPAPLESVGREFYVRNPERDEARPGGQIEERDKSGWLQFRETPKAGAYEISLDPKAPPLVTFAVQGPADAGELRYADAETVKAMLEAEAGETANTQPALAAVVKKSGYSRELWFPILLLVTVLLFVETGLAHRFSQSK